MTFKQVEDNIYIIGLVFPNYFDYLYGIIDSLNNNDR